MAKAGKRIDGGAGKHFVPSSLLPYGGFGDPDTPVPFWKPARSVDVHKIALSQAQDRYMRAVRSHLRDAGLSDEEFEKQLGYRRYGLSRKLNGQELMTMRDLLRINDEVPNAVLALRSGEKRPALVAESKPSFRKNAKHESAPFHQALLTAVAALEEAAAHLDETEKNKGVALGDTLRSLGDVANEIGKAIASAATLPSQSRKGVRG